MSIRDKLKQREEARDKAASGAGGGINAGLPEGVTRYVRLGQELKNGKDFVILADPDNWYFYFVHEDGDYASRATYIKKHTCLNSPKVVGAPLDSFSKPNGNVCLSCKAGAKRKLYFMVPVFDSEYGTWRILDLKEFHAVNLIGDYDNVEGAAKMFNENFSLVGGAGVNIRKSSDGKSYTLAMAKVDAKVLEEAKKLIGQPINFEELANFRSEDDLRKIIEEADAGHVNKAAAGIVAEESTPIGDEPPVNPEDIF